MKYRWPLAPGARGRGVPGRMAPASTLLAFFAIATAHPAPATAQQAATELRIERADGSVQRVGFAQVRGVMGVPLAFFSDLGWTVQESGATVSLSAGPRAAIVLSRGSPFLRWDGRPLQLADAPYTDGQQTYIPFQLVAELFPERLPELYEYDAGTRTLRAGDASAPAGGGNSATGQGVGPAPTPAAARPTVTPAPQPTARPAPAPTEGSASATAPAVLRAPPRNDDLRVVWIDAGHGGADPGAIGHGLREKDIALAISRRVARILGQDRRLEVRMTREDDGFVDLWQRGLLATEAKGERTGVFLSIHANSFPARRATRGFETYFLSEARNEDERRVSAIENAPLSIRGRGMDTSRQSDLDFILRELRSFDHQHWSALLAEMVQDELAKFHPGPNRGVKQGPFAVLTNAIMPSVLVEVGFVTNEEEARLMAQDQFQERAAQAIASAVVRFLERYPSGGGFGSRR